MQELEELPEGVWHALTAGAVLIAYRTAAVDAALGDRASIACSGAFVVSGQGTGIAVGTAMRTELGRIRALISAVEPLKTPLIRQMDAFAAQLTFVILGVSALTLLFALYIRGYTAADAFMTVVGLAVAAIPEGLPAIMTITLASGVQRMAARNAIIRRLPAVETLGAVSVNCSDKTGTLTRNEMTAQSVVLSDAVLAVTGVGYDPKQLPRSDEIPFDAAHRFMATLHHTHEEGAFVLLKGAPERILEMCATERTADGTRPIVPEAWRQRVDEFAAQGQRVLAYARQAAPADKQTLAFADVAEGATLLGLVGFMDAPREEAIAAVADCRSARHSRDHDHRRSRRDGARDCTPARSRLRPAVVDRAGCREARRSRLTRGRPRNIRPARTTPEHKLRLVQALQADGLTVAMIGDGVNDAPALKRADVGVAMGDKGTEVAKEAAEMVLADDNFASIVAAVREGRTVYDNLMKMFAWTLPTNGGEALTILAAITLGLALPITPV